jgi:hypothetical protein
VSDKQTLFSGLATVPLISWVWVLAISGWGGLVAYIGEVKAGRRANLSIVELVGELMTAAFAGTLTFMVGAALGAPELLLAPLVGVAGHMGSKWIRVLERGMQTHLEALARRKGWIPAEEDPPKDGPGA